MLINNLSFVPKDELEQIFKNIKIPLKIRAENLSLKEWVGITNSLKNKEVIHN